jgi:hypothetical protein
MPTCRYCSAFALSPIANNNSFQRALSFGYVSWLDLDMPDSEDARLYANSMSRVRNRVDLVQRLLGRELDLGSEAFDAELVYLQFRKILEEIAFSSLAANKTEYSALHANFAQHWKAEKILQELEKLNPNFYPKPLESPKTLRPGFHHFDQLSTGFLTREEFAALYDISSQVLHTRNPYSQRDVVVQARYSGDQWVSRIQRLLSWHSVQLLSGEILVVNIPPSGTVHVYPSSASADVKQAHAEETSEK